MWIDVSVNVLGFVCEFVFLVGLFSDTNKLDMLLIQISVLVVIIIAKKTSSFIVGIKKIYAFSKMAAPALKASVQIAKVLKTLGPAIKVAKNVNKVYKVYNYGSKAQDYLFPDEPVVYNENGSVPYHEENPEFLHAQYEVAMTTYQMGDGVIDSDEARYNQLRQEYYGSHRLCT